MSTGWTRVGSSLEISGGGEQPCQWSQESQESQLQGPLEYKYERHKSEHGSRREVDHERLSDNSALPLRVAHTTVVPRGGEGALASRAETNLVEPFGSAAFGYPHPPMPQKKQNEYAWQAFFNTEEGSKLRKEYQGKACLGTARTQKGSARPRLRWENRRNATETEDTRPKTAKTEAPCGGLQMKNQKNKLLGWGVMI
ncbi:hypothetical protein EDD16DRAFT_1722715 [Pisolithus croceorrhizus]|nr:hypothetical protein EDD16DRAFT_1722715 [Pisolithus croceorrhizus]